MSLPANKLVFVGSMGAGKTTAVRAISDIEPVSTEMPLSGDTVGDATSPGPHDRGDPAGSAHEHRAGRSGVC